MADVWRAANWYEREQFDLLGVAFLGHPDLRRILLPDDWPGHPMRKDYKEASVVPRHADDAPQHARAPAHLGQARAGQGSDERAHPRLRGDRRRDDPQHGSAASVDARRDPLHHQDRRRDHARGDPRRRLPASRHRAHRREVHLRRASCPTPIASTTCARCPPTTLGARRREAGRSRGAGARRVSARHHRRAQPHLVALHRARRDGDGHRRHHAVHVHLARARVRQRPARDDLRRAAHLQLSPHRRRRLGHADGLARQGAALVRSLRAGDGRVRSADHEQRAVRAATGQPGGHQRRRRRSTTAWSGRTCAPRASTSTCGATCPTRSIPS